MPDLCVEMADQEGEHIMDTPQQLRVKIVRYVNDYMKQNPKGSLGVAEIAAATRTGEPAVGAELQYLIESGKLKKHSQPAGQTFPRVIITPRGQAEAEA